MKDFAIRCRDLSLGYENSAVLEGVSLEIPKGVFLPFIGPNGAGKTTFLRAVLGFLKPMAGQLETDFDSRPAGYVPQFRSIDPLFPVTVREIVEMGLYPALGWWKLPGSAEKSEVERAIRELGLEKEMGKNYRDLSGGTRQKVLIARALVSDARVFVMDEPTSELDESSEREVFAHLMRFVREQGRTVLVAHHGLSRLLESAAREVCVVNHGKIQIKNVSELKAGMVF